MKKTKGSSFRFYATLLLYFLTFSLSRAFYLPGVAPRDFQKEIKENSNGNLASPVISAVKNLSVCLDVKSEWNPRDDELMKAVKEALHVSKAPSTVVCREDEQRRVLSV